MYDNWCTKVREGTKSSGVILIVFGGEAGSGFSMQATPELTMALPAILRNVADQIDRDGGAISERV